MIETARILLAEDDPGDIELVEFVLEDLGWRTQTAVVRDGVAALDYLFRRGAYLGRAQGHPDLLLLDLKLPRVSGLEALQQIRASEELRGVRVVVFSSSLADKDRHDSLSLGADEFAVKPIAFKDFRTEVTRLVNAYVAR